MGYRPGAADPPFMGVAGRAQRSGAAAIYIYIYIYIYIHIYTHIYIYVLIYIYCFIYVMYDMRTYLCDYMFGSINIRMRRVDARLR